MKKILLVISFLSIVFSCNNENAPDCLKTTGEIKEHKIDVEEFTSIDVHNNIHITIEQGNEQSVTLTTGANMFNEITFEVLDEELIIKDLNKCDWARPYGNLNVHIVTPQLSQIRSSGSGIISSRGTLKFSNYFILTSRFHTADFVMDLEVPELEIVNNDVSNFYISGLTDKLIIKVQSGDGRIDATNLVVNDILFFHYGTNDITVNATYSLTGEIRAPGNIFYCIEPTILDVQIYDDRGELIRSCD